LALWIICAFLFLISTSPPLSRIPKLRPPLYFLTWGAVGYQAIDHKVFPIFYGIAILEIWAIVFVAGVLKVTTKEKKISDLAFSRLLLLASLLALFKSYSDNLYPKITNQFGGGKPVAVTLLLIRDEKSGLELLFHDDQKLSERMQDVALLDEDADYFFVQKQTGQKIETIRIRKPLVNAIIQQKSGDLPPIPKSTGPKRD
jgi:hypothetical protein